MLELKLFNEENITDEYLNWFKDKGFTRYLEAKDITKQQALEHYRQCKTDGSFFLCNIRRRPCRQYQTERR